MSDICTVIRAAEFGTRVGFNSHFKDLHHPMTCCQIVMENRLQHEVSLRITCDRIYAQCVYDCANSCLALYNRLFRASNDSGVATSPTKSYHPDLISESEQSVTPLKLRASGRKICRVFGPP
uniref:Uncharacterized protein n=1 Tax=Physcomitrium patens TaxID=3218 RepID=A0A2K1JQU7_PHYPA|nr:hypothetical protein PHYPA_016291 [Physcomitrium patens]